MNVDIRISSRVLNFFIDSKFDLKTNVKFRIEYKTDLKTKQTDSY